MDPAGVILSLTAGTIATWDDEDVSRGWARSQPCTRLSIQSLRSVALGA
jgi:hypothetical protein